MYLKKSRLYWLRCQPCFLFPSAIYISHLQKVFHKLHSLVGPALIPFPLTSGSQFEQVTGIKQSPYASICLGVFTHFLTIYILYMSTWKGQDIFGMLIQLVWYGIYVYIFVYFIPFTLRLVKEPRARALVRCGEPCVWVRCHGPLNAHLARRQPSWHSDDWKNHLDSG